MKLKKLLLMLTFFVLLGTTAFAQSLLYVDVTNGSDAYTGVNATNNPAGTGPKATFAAARALVTNGGTIVIKAGTYAEGLDLSTGLIAATNSYTIQLSQLNANNNVNFSGKVVNITNVSDPAGPALRQITAAGHGLVVGDYVVAAAGNALLPAGTYTVATVVNANTVELTGLVGTGGAANATATTLTAASKINKAGLTVNITRANGTEVLNTTSTTAHFANGSVNLSEAAGWVIANGTTLYFTGASGLTNTAPTKTTNVSLVYLGGSSINAGPESNYGSYGTGEITVNKTAGTTVTFPNAITALAGLTVTSGNATFSGAVTVAAGATDVVNNGTGTLTFNGALSLGIITGGTADANIASLYNTSSGSVVANSTVTWTVPATLAAAAFAAGAGTTDGITNSGTGTLILNGAVTLNAPNNTTGNDYSFFAQNTTTGTLTIGALSTPSSGSGNFEGTLNLVGAAAAGTININGGTFANVVTVNAGHTLNVLANTTVGGVFTNAGTTAIGANNLTLSGNVAHLTVGGTVTASSGRIFVTSTGGGISFNGGTLGNVTNNGAGNTVNISAGTTFTSLTATAGTVTLGAAVTIGTLTLDGGNVTNGNFTMTVTTYNQSAGTLTLAANAASILDVKGGFNRTGGTFTAGAASLVSFTGSGAQSVNGGPLFQVSRLTFNNAGGIITVGNSIRASGAIIIATATNVDFSTTNLIMNGGAATSTITNNGTYTAIGGGGVVVGGVNTVTGGVAGAGAGATYTLQGTGTYSYITVDVGAGNLAEVVTTVTGVKWNGVLTLRSGTLDVATAGVDFGPTGSAASIVRYPQDSPGITTSAGTFNAANVSYDLTYTGALLGHQAVGSEISATPANVKTWTIQTTGAFLNTLPAGANLNFGGTLYIEDGATLNLPAGAATQFILSGNSKTHTIKGTISLADGGDVISVTGTPVTINGSTTVAHAATLGNFTTSSTDLTIANIQSFAGTFATTGSAVVSLGMGGSTLAAADQVITGAVTLGGTSLTLTTNITSTAGVTQNAGTVVLNGSNLIMNNNYNQTVGTITSTGGYLQFNTAATLTLVSAVPYLRANDVTITTGSALTISENLDLVDPAGGALGVIATAAAAHDVTIQKTMTTSGGAVFTGAGDLILAGAPTTVTASGDLTISNVTVNTTSTATLATSDPTTPTARTFTLTGVLTHIAGELALGINHVALTGAGAVYSRTDGTITASSGELQFNGAAAQSAAQGTGFSIPNLTINNSTGAVAAPWDVAFAGGATNDFTVTGTLKLSRGVFYTNATAGKLHIGNLATISRVADFSSLNQAPTFDGDVNLTYPAFNAVGAAAMANEAPSSASAKLNNITVNVGAGSTLNTGATRNFKGTATLTSGTFGNTGGALTVTSGATVVKNAGAFNAAPTVTNYNLRYTSTQATTNNEFISGNVDLLTIAPGAAGTVTLNANKTVKDLTITNGTLANGGFNLTVTGNFNASAGAFTGAGALVFGGTTAQTFTVAAGGQALAGNLTINNAAGVTLSGGSLTMNAGTTVTFTSGILSTGANWIQFAHAANTQGFTRTGGWVNGNVRHAITAGAGSPTVYANGRYEFPVGTATRFRPYAITFSSTNPAINPTNIVVGMVDSSPLGTMNLDAGNGLKIAGYPAYYWLVTANPSSFTSTQLFDVELTGTNIGIPYTSDQNLRIVRRQDGAAEYNPWSLQNGSTYANYSVISGTDTTAVVRTTASIGGIVTQGTRFSIGVPARVPTFGATPTTFTVAEGATTTNTLQVTATAQNAGETITGYTKVSGPAWAAISAAGLITFTPGYSDYSATAYPVVVRATSSTGLTADLTVNVTVTNTNRVPTFTGGTVVTNQEIPYGAVKTFQYAAKDDDNEALTYTVDVTPASAATGADAPTITGALGNAAVLTWKPAFADLNKEFVVTVTAKDASNATATTSATIKVVGAYARGNANLLGSVDIDDAIAVLKHVVGNPTLSAEALIPADANLDGTVNAVDASWILKYIAGGVWVAPKVAATAGNVEFGRLVGENSVYSLPINVTSTSGVTAVYAEVDVNGVEVNNVSARLPQGWLSSYAIENGKIKFAAAGVTPLTDGTVANIELKLNSKETVVSVVGNAKLNEEVTSLLNAKVREIPSEFALSQNYPNPFNPTTSIKFQVAQDAKVSLVVYDMLGQRVRTLVDGIQEAGFYTVRWDGSNDFGSKVSSGIYIYRLQAGNFVSTMKMNLMK